MAGRVPLIAIAFALGIAVASLIPGVSPSLRKLVDFQPAGEPSSANARQEPDKADGKTEEKPAIVTLTEEQIANAHIELAAAESGVLSQRIVVPGVIVPDANRVAR